MQKVLIYSTSVCPYCHMAKDFMKERGVAYEDINLTEQPDRMHELTDWSGQMGVPVIVVGNAGDDGKFAGQPEVIIGFNKKKLNELFPPQAANDNQATSEAAAA